MFTHINGNNYRFESPIPLAASWSQVGFKSVLGWLLGVKLVQVGPKLAPSWHSPPPNVSLPLHSWGGGNVGKAASWPHVGPMLPQVGPKLALSWTTFGPKLAPSWPHANTAAFPPTIRRTRLSPLAMGVPGGWSQIKVSFMNVFRRNRLSANKT